MKKIILITVVSILLLGCRYVEPKPIEKYGGGKYVITEIHWYDFGRKAEILLKNKDTIFEVRIIKFDAMDLKVGDTIKQSNEIFKSASCTLKRERT